MPPPRLAVRRITGPSTLDAELESVAPLLRECYRHVRSGESAPALTLTLLERRTAPLLIARIEPADAPAPLVGCVAEVLGREIVQPLGAAEPMVVTMGPAP